MHEEEYLDRMMQQAEAELDMAIDLYCQEDQAVTEYLYWRQDRNGWHLSQSVWSFLEK